MAHVILKKSTRHSGGRLQESFMDVDEDPSAKQSGTGGATAYMNVQCRVVNKTNSEAEIL